MHNWRHAEQLGDLRIGLDALEALSVGDVSVAILVQRLEYVHNLVQWERRASVALALVRREDGLRVVRAKSQTHQEACERNDQHEQEEDPGVVPHGIHSMLFETDDLLLQILDLLKWVGCVASRGGVPSCSCGVFFQHGQGDVASCKGVLLLRRSLGESIRSLCAASRINQGEEEETHRCRTDHPHQKTAVGCPPLPLLRPRAPVG
mmetsp:Transcript_27527/g.56421  ORF Transcript_27527/g.56421 Transcript_27527/m.56421 type:complete len:206 (-) Transcript_27527:50-667(-)